MYLKTPKRYQRGHRRSIISLRWAWLWILTPIVVFVGMHIYNNKDQYTPQVEAVMGNVFNEAQETLSTAMAPTPLPTENPSIQLAAANSAWERGAIDEAVNNYQAVLDAVPNEVTPHYRVALGLVMSGQTDEAVEAAERAVTADPYSADAWAIRAMALDWAARPGEAIASAQRALELAGDTNPQAAARAQAFLAEAYYDLGQYDRALSAANQALEINPDSYEAYRNRALIVQNTQFDFEAALDDLQIAYDLAPHLPYITMDLALILTREEGVDSSIALLNELIELNPNNTRILYLLGAQYLNLVGDLSSATDYLSRCTEIDPDNISCTYLLGRAQMRNDQPSAAAETFQKVLNLGSEDPYHYWWAGRSQVVLGSCSAAAPFYRRGYQMAQQNGDETLIGDYEFEMQNCQLLTLPEATEEATEEPAVDGEQG